MSSHDGFEASHTPIAPARYESPYEVARSAVLAGLIPPGDGRAALDLGCGPGHYCRRLTERGWRATAVDTDPDNLAYAAEHAAATHLGDALEVLPSLPAEQYELVLALELIEHLPRDRGEALVGGIRRVLKPGGALLLSTPNRWSLEGLGGYLWGEKLRGWGKWMAWDPTHVHVYSSGEILRLVKAAGFAVENVAGLNYAGPLPLVGTVGPALASSARWPMNRLGFDTIVECRKA